MEKKVAFLACSTGWGGLEMHIVKLHQWLSQRNNKVLLFTSSASALAGKKEEINAQPIVIPRKGKYFDIINAFLFSKRLKREGVKTVILFANQDLDFIFFTKLFYRDLKIIYQQHMQIGIAKKDWLHTLRFMAIDLWITPLERLKEEVISRTNFDRQKIVVQPLGVEPVSLQRRERKKHSPVTQRTLHLGIIGRIDEGKGQLFVLHCLRLLKEKGFNIHLTVTGSPTIDDPSALEYEQKLLDFVQDAGLSAHVTFQHHQSNSDEFFDKTDICVLASRSETFGLVAIEAMLREVIVMAPDSGNTIEILDYGKLGIIYRYGDQEDFCQKVLSYIDHEDDYQKMITHALQCAREKFNPKKECTLFEDHMI